MYCMPSPRKKKLVWYLGPPPSPPLMATIRGWYCKQTPLFTVRKPFQWFILVAWSIYSTAIRQGLATPVVQYLQVPTDNSSRCSDHIGISRVRTHLTLQRIWQERNKKYFYFFSFKSLQIYSMDTHTGWGDDLWTAFCGPAADPVGGLWAEGLAKSARRPSKWHFTYGGSGGWPSATMFYRGLPTHR
jgi:hypothetical protein